MVEPCAVCGRLYGHLAGCEVPQIQALIPFLVKDYSAAYLLSLCQFITSVRRVRSSDFPIIEKEGEHNG